MTTARGTALVVVVCALLLGIAAPAQALPVLPVPDTGESVVSSTHYVIPEQYLARKALEDFRCEARQQLPPRSATRQIALDRAQARLRTLVSPQALRAFRASPLQRSKPQLEGAMALATMNGSLGAAAAASLRLAQLSKQPRHMINAAVLLQMMQSADIAADLLAWAKQEPLGRMAGVDGTAAWQSAMGAVLLSYGQFPEARTAYEAALAREPLLAMARQGVARALYCQGEEFLATKWQGRSATVLDPVALIADDLVEPGDPPSWTASARPGLLDVSAGKRGPRFLPFTVPEGPDIPMGQYSQAVLKQWAESLVKTSEDLDVPEMSYTQHLLDSYLRETIYTDPVLAGLAKRTRDLSEELPAILGQSMCGTVDYFDDFWEWMSDNYEVMVQTADRMHVIMTSAAAATGDPKLNAYYNDDADRMVESIYQGFLQGLFAYSGEAENHAQVVRYNDDARKRNDPIPFPDCHTSFLGGSKSGEYTKDGPNGTGERANPCSRYGPLAKVNVVNIELPIPGAPVKPKLAINCESVSLSAKFASVGLPFAELGLFGGASYEWFTGDIVLSAGGYAELGPLKVNAGPQLRMGLNAEGDFVVKDFSYVTKPGFNPPPKSGRASAVGTTYLVMS